MTYLLLALGLCCAYVLACAVAEVLRYGRPRPKARLDCAYYFAALREAMKDADECDRETQRTKRVA